MKLSRTACYAIHAVAFMADQEEDGIVIGHRAAKTLGIPAGFLLRILVSLSRARILSSVKGPNGGYRLARPSREITLLHIVEAVEGPVRGSVQFTPANDSRNLDRRLQEICDLASESIRRHLHKVRISEFVTRSK